MHLTLEALARLLDEPGTPDEAAHLRDCLACRRELAGLGEQTAALAALGGRPRDEAWTELEARLRREGLVRGTRRSYGGVRRELRAAAAIALLLAGGAAGALLWGERAAQPAAVVDAGAPPHYGVPGHAVDVEPEPVLRPVAAPLPTAGGARLVSTTEPSVPAMVRSYATAPEPPALRGTAREADRAARELLEAQAAFVDALARLAEAADPASGNDPATRLAALDRLVSLTAVALEAAPGVPVVNGYHLAAAAERDRLRREIDRDGRTEWF